MVPLSLKRRLPLRLSGLGRPPCVLSCSSSDLQSHDSPVMETWKQCVATDHTEGRQHAARLGALLQHNGVQAPQPCNARVLSCHVRVAAVARAAPRLLQLSRAARRSRPPLRWESQSLRAASLARARRAQSAEPLRERTRALHLRDPVTARSALRTSRAAGPAPS